MNSYCIILIDSGLSKHVPKAVVSKIWVKEILFAKVAKPCIAKTVTNELPNL